MFSYQPKLSSSVLRFPISPYHSFHWRTRDSSTLIWLFKTKFTFRIHTARIIQIASNFDDGRRSGSFQGNLWACLIGSCYGEKGTFPHTCSSRADGSSNKVWSCIGSEWCPCGEFSLGNGQKHTEKALMYHLSEGTGSSFNPVPTFLTNDKLYFCFVLSPEAEGWIAVIWYLWGVV